MKRTYTCPGCTATLNPNVKIILTAIYGERRGLVLLSPQPGNYKAIIPTELGFSAGDLVEFRCPVCNADLTSATDPRMAEIDFRFSTGTTGRVAFSRKYGEHATYFVSDQEVEAYGDHADNGGYNFFGAGRDQH